MAAVGPAKIIPFTIGTSQIVGQGNLPIVRCRISFDDLSVESPMWVEIPQSKLRSASTSRGRESELSDFDAGSAEVVIDNRNRDFDPTNTASPYYPHVTPMNRIWIYEEFSGEIHSLFRGYVDSWDQGWEGGGWSDATVKLACSDEFKRLSLALLPTTSPPRDSYEDLVNSDGPEGYWRLNEPAERQIQEAAAPGKGNPYSGGLLPLFGSNRRNGRRAIPAGRR